MSITKNTTTMSLFTRELEGLMLNHQFWQHTPVPKEGLLSFRTSLKKYRNHYLKLTGREAKGFTIYDMLSDFGYEIVDSKPNPKDRYTQKLEAFVVLKEKFTEADLKKVRYLCKKISPNSRPRKTLKRLNLKDVYKFKA